MWTEVWGYKLYKYSWDICCSNKDLTCRHSTNTVSFSTFPPSVLSGPAEQSERWCDSVTVMNKPFHRLLIICDFHSDGLAWTSGVSGMSGKDVGVAVLSLAAVAAGCYVVFKVSVKVGSGLRSKFYYRITKLINKIQRRRRRKILSRRRRKSLRTPQSHPLLWWRKKGASVY